MNFINPWGFLAMLGVPLILLMYILKQKFNKQEVSSMILWQKVIQQSEGHKWRQKLKKNIVMFLQIAAVIFAAFALANPFIAATGERLDYVFVVDTSFSMLSTDENPSRLERAKNDINKIIEESPDNTVFSIVNLNNNPEIVVNRTSEKSVAKNGIVALKQTYSGYDTEALISILRVLQSENKANVYIFTDKNTDTKIEEATIKIYGNSSNNYAVKLVSENAGNVLVNVESYGEEQGVVPVAIFGDGVIIDTKDVSFAGNGDSQDVVFSLDGGNYNTITAKVVTEDILAEDNSFVYVNKIVKEQKVILLSEGNIFLEKALSLVGGVDLYKKGTKDIENLSGYDIYIFDGALPKILPNDGQILVFNPPAGNEIFEAKDDVEISKITVNSPTFSENANNLSFVVGKSKVLTMPSWAGAVVSGEETVLVYTGTQNNRKICVFGFDLHNSDLPLKKEFPIIVYNIINFFAPGAINSPSGTFAGSSVEINIMPKTVNADVIFPDGSTKAVAMGDDLFEETQAIGVYTIRETFENGNTQNTAFAINPVTTGESEMEDGKEISAKNDSKTTVATGKSLKTLALIIVLLVLVAEWWVNWRGN